MLLQFLILPGPYSSHNGGRHGAVVFFLHNGSTQLNWGKLIDHVTGVFFLGLLHVVVVVKA